jgi:hypothetical protein
MFRWFACVVLVVVMAGCAAGGGAARGDDYIITGWGKGGDMGTATLAAFANARQKLDASGLQGYGLVEDRMISKSSDGWIEVGIRYRVVPSVRVEPMANVEPGTPAVEWATIEGVDGVASTLSPDVIPLQADQWTEERIAAANAQLQKHAVGRTLRIKLKVHWIGNDEQKGPTIWAEEIPRDAFAFKLAASFRGGFHETAGRLAKGDDIIIEGRVVESRVTQYDVVHLFVRLVDARIVSPLP